MSLGGALQIGRTGLLANQAALSVTGNNLANAATPGYHRQVATMSAVGDNEVARGIFVGRGVQISAITRQISNALETRLNGAVSDESASSVRKDVLTRIESLENELSGNDLSTQLDEFFNAWSELANTPQDNSVRNVVVQKGTTLASFVRNLSSGFTDLRNQVDDDIAQATNAVDDLLTRIESLNQQIIRVDQGTQGAHSLRDQRDQLVQQLAQYMDVSTVESPAGALDVYVGSTPIVLDGKSRGVELRRTTLNGAVQIDVVLKDDKTTLTPASGKIGALISTRQNDVNAAIDTLDTFANELIYQVNRVHSQGQPTASVTALTGTSKVADATAALNSSTSGLNFPVNHGSFEVYVTQKSTGIRVAKTVNVTLDGVNAGSQTTLNSLVGDLNGVANLSASVTADGRIQINTSSSDFSVSFGNDSSGALAALGVNTYFTGSNAQDIAVNTTVSSNPQMIAASRDGSPGDNRTALALANLRTSAIPSLGNITLKDLWGRHVADYAVRSSQATQQLSSDTLVKENLMSQAQAVSGVNTDEEAINLLSYQRAYQASARFLSVVDQMFQTLLAIQ